LAKKVCRKEKPWVNTNVNDFQSKMLHKHLNHLTAGHYKPERFVKNFNWCQWYVIFLLFATDEG